MKSQSSAGQIVVTMTGPIGESTPLFSTPIGDAKELVLEMTDVTYINSIGVKHWIMWTLRIPKNCLVKIINAPLVIVSQANTVVGFLSRTMQIESFRIPYACEDCGFEEMHVAQRGREYQYPTATEPKKIAVVPELPCPKCGKGKLEPDIFIEKTFKFLEPR